MMRSLSQQIHEHRKCIYWLIPLGGPLIQNSQFVIRFAFRVVFFWFYLFSFVFRWLPLWFPVGLPFRIPFGFAVAVPPGL